MSSILDSLKKLEKETAQQEQLPTRARVDRKAVVPTRIIFTIGIVCLFVTAVGLAAYYKGWPNKHPESPAGNVALATKPAAAPDAPEKTAAPLKDAPAPLPAQVMERNAATTAAAPEVNTSNRLPAAKPMPTEDTGPRQKGVPESEQTAALKEPPQEDPVIDRPIQEPEPQPLAMEADPPDSLDDASPKELATKKEPMQIDRLEGVGFKIQAISWSEVPEQSLAVINSQVLREGDGIEGYHINRINPDDIVLLRGGKAYRLAFRSTGLP